MSTVVLRYATRYLMPILVVCSLFLLWRGHHEPGGGFVGGLVAAVACLLHACAHGAAATRRLVRVEPLALAAAGVLVALAAGLAGPLVGEPFLRGLWAGGFGTPLLFDVGVYLAVLGMVLGTALVLMESE